MSSRKRVPLPKPKVVVVCGDRHWTDRAMIEADLRGLVAGSIVYEGECPTGGADILCRDAIREVPALRRALTLRMVPAKWRLYGKGAGPQRNAEMLTDAQREAAARGYALEVWAYHDDLGASAGTAHMVGLARARKVTVALRAHEPVPMHLPGIAPDSGRKA